MRALARLGAFQARAESLFGCTFAAYSPNGTTTVDGLEVQAYAAQGTTSGKVQGGSSSTQDTATREVTVGGVSRPVLVGGLHIPVSAPVPVAGDLGVGWVYHCTAAVAPADVALMGRWFLVVNAPAKTYATARRLDVVEVPVPEVFA